MHIANLPGPSALYHDAVGNADLTAKAVQHALGGSSLEETTRQRLELRPLLDGAGG